MDEAEITRKLRELLPPLGENFKVQMIGGGTVVLLLAPSFALFRAAGISTWMSVLAAVGTSTAVFSARRSGRARADRARRSSERIVDETGSSAHAGDEDVARRADLDLDLGRARDLFAGVAIGQKVRRLVAGA